MHRRQGRRLGRCGSHDDGTARREIHERKIRHAQIREHEIRRREIGRGKSRKSSVKCTGSTMEPAARKSASTVKPSAVCSSATVNSGAAMRSCSRGTRLEQGYPQQQCGERFADPSPVSNLDSRGNRADKCTASTLNPGEEAISKFGINPMQ